jgi:hypothetical protein
MFRLHQEMLVLAGVSTKALEECSRLHAGLGGLGNTALNAVSILSFELSIPYSTFAFHP